jgi:hypothetical protein
MKQKITYENYQINAKQAKYKKNYLAKKFFKSLNEAAIDNIFAKRFLVFDRFCKDEMTRESRPIKLLQYCFYANSIFVSTPE